MKNSARLFSLLCCLFVVASVEARVISYAPVSDKFAVPAVQSRLVRHYLLMESDTAAPLSWGCQISAGCPSSPLRRGQLVLYDAYGLQQPRVLLWGGTPEPSLLIAAMWEGKDEVPRIFVITDASLGGDNPQRAQRLLYSRDAGTNWSVITFAPGSAIADSTYYEDVGGPYVRARGSQIRIGNEEVPFVFTVFNTIEKTSRIWGLHADGTPQLLADMLGPNANPCCTASRLVGSDRKGTRFLITGARRSSMSPTQMLWILDFKRGLTEVAPIPKDRAAWLDGWITGEGDVYVEDRGPYGRRSLTFYDDGRATEVAAPFPGVPAEVLGFFAVPTHDYSGAWIIQRGPGHPSVLSRHQPGGPLLEQWRDISGPEVEAIHAGSSGERLLIQVHRPRPMADQRLFIDPALAIWNLGDPAPREYDELYLIEGPGKAFVHLDVEWVARGEPFVFDGASITALPPPPSQISAAPGGGDVVQEWGVVRSSLQQRLVLPGVSRLAGLHGSLWRSDVVLRNPSPEVVSTRIRYVPNHAGEPVKETTVDLQPQEIRVIRDALKTLFDVDSGGGAFFISPELGRAIHVTSRTYSDSPQGTFGMGMGGVDIFAAAGPRFPVTFAGAFQGADFRTNVIVTDVSRHGTRIEMQLGSDREVRAQSYHELSVPAGGQSQFNSVGSLLNLSPWETGALVFRPTQGDAIGSVIVIDNRTNDPTYFPPDLPAPYVRTIPVIGHIDGMNGSKFRSDLFLFNTADQVRTVILAAKLWNENVAESQLRLTMLPRESKIIRDVLFTAFGKTGLARLRYQSGTVGEAVGVRVSSRTYTLEPSGATYGLEIPPLNSFQSASAGDTLEILGVFGGENFRTNLALVELTAFPTGGSARVRIEIVDERGATIDSFETNVPVAGGIQLLDLFRARGLGDGPSGAVIRVSPFGGMVGAFATAVDNGTNDPTYFGAALGSR